MKLEQEIVIAAKSGLAFTLNQHQVLRVIDKDLTEKLSTGVTIDQNGSLLIQIGSHLIAISACPVEESKCNGYQCTPIKVQVYS